MSIEDVESRPYYSKPEYFERRTDYHWFLIENGFEPDHEFQDGAMLFSRPFAAVMSEQYTKAAFLGRRSAEFIREQAGRPWLLSVNFLEPHTPNFGPFNDLHDPAALPVGPAFGVLPPGNGSKRNRVIAAHYSHDREKVTEAYWRRQRANYYGLVTLVDRAVGRILDALEESGQAKNTIVVYTSDHGDMVGDHGITDKVVLYEESVRIPLLISDPLAGGQHRKLEGRISQIDLVPTLLELMGRPLGDHLQGRSRARVVRGDETLAGNDVIIEWNGSSSGIQPPVSGFADEEVNHVLSRTWRSIISCDGWKLNLCTDDQCELYDLNADPYEQTNLFNTPAHRDRIRDLTSRIRAWQQQSEDTVALQQT